MNDNQFLFREAEFEDECFDAPAFVGRYRRVSSLESLKDQLRQYCEVLKRQLYTVINKDYKDFITIATKLDGVDSRVELLRKPLVDLRFDLSLLHDGLLSSKQAIQETINRKNEVMVKRQHVESALMCLEKLDIAESIVGGLGSSKNCVVITAAVPEGKEMTRRDLVHALHKAKKSSAFSNLSSSAFDSSELERASHALAHAQLSLGTLTAPSSGSGLPPSLLGLSKTLNQRVAQLSDQLLARIKARLGDILSEASSTSASDDAVRVASASMKRSLAHCLRAVSALNRGDVAESAVSESIAPHIKSTLTLGRVDGAGGRGSYSGLGDALSGLLAALGGLLTVPLTLAENVSSGEVGRREADVDLLVSGVWVPVVNVLLERFPGIFSVGIASTLARCYRAVEQFTTSLVDLIDFSAGRGESSSSSSGTTEERRQAVLARVLSHSAVKALHGRWDLSLYAQLRVQEVAARLEKAFEIATQSGLTASAFDAVHALPAATVTVMATAVIAPSTEAVVPSVAAAKSLMRTLTPQEVTELRAMYKLGSATFALPVVLVCAVEAATCLHPQVLIKQLVPDLLALAMRCMARLEAHVALTVDVPTPFFPKGAASLPAVSVADNPAAPAPSASAQSAGPASTPSKAANAAAATTPSTASSPPTLSTDELVVLSQDLYTVARWLELTFLPRALELYPATSINASSAITACVASQCGRLDGTRSSVWTRLSSILGNECKRNLHAIKAVAGKYRMTNKPQPESASQYVESVLSPLKLFLNQYGPTIAAFAPRGTEAGAWDVDLVEDVTSSFLLHVQSLMETVKQMDTALQRRSKLRAGANSAGAGMSDSDKISLQISLDVKAYGAEIASMGIPLGAIPSFALLESEVEKAAVEVGGE